MKKQGFTLIELMVVIVIMGILAAVAVPKLFGMIAKSKASEVGPAAGTYVKLQQAYVSEAANIGNWEMVGYAAPGGTAGTTNFEYKEPATASWTNKTVELSAGMTNAWVAHNKTKLNECAQGDNWTVSVEEAQLRNLEELKTWQELAKDFTTGFLPEGVTAEKIPFEKGIRFNIVIPPGFFTNRKAFAFSPTYGKSRVGALQILAR